MSLAYKDFYPTVLKSGLFSTEHEALLVTVTRANGWIAKSGVSVINVETVVLPNVGKLEDVSHARMSTGGEMNYWYQVVRVWYKKETPSA